MAYRFDEDLEFLRDMQSKDLEVLVETLTKANTGRLSKQSGYKAHYPNRNHIRYVDEIMEELQLFGGNTFVNLIRRQGVPYREILCDVCDKMKVNYNKKSSVSHIESELFSKILEKSIEQMDSKELEKLAKDAKIDTAKGFSKQAAIAAMQGAVKAGGFMSYQIALIVANAVAKQVLGRGLSIAANAGLTRAIGVFAGPIGWAITALWTAADIAGPAYRITLPAVIQVAFLRKRFLNTTNVFLTGETGVGKDTILTILKEGKFLKNPDSTSKLQREIFDTYEKTLRVINTAGSERNEDENIEARRNLIIYTKYVYVFKADDYLADEKVKKRVQMDLENDKELCERDSLTLKIIGTHKDKALENGASEAEIQKIADELSEKGKFQCQILDLTQFNGEEKQRELCNFIAN